MGKWQKMAQELDLGPELRAAIPWWAPRPRWLGRSRSRSRRILRGRCSDWTPLRRELLRIWGFWGYFLGFGCWYLDGISWYLDGILWYFGCTYQERWVIEGARFRGRPPATLLCRRWRSSRDNAIPTFEPEQTWYYQSLDQIAFGYLQCSDVARQLDLGVDQVDYWRCWHQRHVWWWKVKKDCFISLR